MSADDPDYEALLNNVNGELKGEIEDLVNKLKERRGNSEGDKTNIPEDEFQKFHDISKELQEAQTEVLMKCICSVTEIEYKTLSDRLKQDLEKGEKGTSGTPSNVQNKNAPEASSSTIESQTTLQEGNFLQSLFSGIEKIRKDSNKEQKEEAKFPHIADLIKTKLAVEKMKELLANTETIINNNMKELPKNEKMDFYKLRYMKRFYQVPRGGGGGEAKRPALCGCVRRHHRRDLEEEIQETVATRLEQGISDACELIEKTDAMVTSAHESFQTMHAEHFQAKIQRAHLQDLIQKLIEKMECLVAMQTGLASPRYTVTKISDMPK